MKKKIIVEVDDTDEVLMKFKIEKKSLFNFLGSTVTEMDNVCTPMENTSSLTETERDEIRIAMLEDSVYNALMDPKNESTYSVIMSPIKKKNYVNGEYQEIRDTYITKNVMDSLEKFAKK